jgi:hypothetical protein
MPRKSIAVAAPTAPAAATKTKATGNTDTKRPLAKVNPNENDRAIGS